MSNTTNSNSLKNRPMLPQTTSLSSPSTKTIINSVGQPIVLVDTLAIQSTATELSINTSQEFIRTEVGLQNPDVAKSEAASYRRLQKSSARNSTDTIADLTARIVALEATVSRLVGCYPICTPTPTPTRTVTPTPTRTVTPTPTRTVTPTPTVVFEISPSSSPVPPPTPTPTPTPSS